MATYDLILKGGTLLDPASGEQGRRDIGISHQHIAAVEAEIPDVEGELVLDIADKLVVPGFIDLHGHVYTGVTKLGIGADETSAASGVTTVVDAGSAGAHTFGGFRKLVVETQRTRVLSLCHISLIGLAPFPESEMSDLSMANVEAAARTVTENRDVCLGIKVRQSTSIVGENGLEPLRRAIEAATKAGCPVMVHIGGTPVPLPELLSLLRSGDVITHCFNGRPNGVLDEHGTLLEACREAQARGILFDIGHGAGSFNFDVCRAALDQGMFPDTISTDLHIVNVNGPVFDMPTTLSKFLALGLSLEETIRRATVVPARWINSHLARPIEGLGTLTVGAPGDVAVVDIEEGAFEFTDADGNRLTANQRFKVHHTVSGGRLWGRPYQRPSR